MTRIRHTHTHENDARARAHAPRFASRATPIPDFACLNASAIVRVRGVFARPTRTLLVVVILARSSDDAPPTGEGFDRSIVFRAIDAIDAFETSMIERVRSSAVDRGRSVAARGWGRGFAPRFGSHSVWVNSVKISIHPCDAGID